VECEYPVDLPKHDPSCHQGNVPLKPADFAASAGAAGAVGRVIPSLVLLLLLVLLLGIW
jgi:hypothetical protein